MYELGNYKKNSLPSATKTVPVFTSGGNNNYYVTKDNIENYKDNNDILSIDNQTFKDYLVFLSNSLEFDNVKYQNVVNFLVMERCIETDNCKYAYLEVFDDEITP